MIEKSGEESHKRVKRRSHPQCRIARGVSTKTEPNRLLNPLKNRAVCKAGSLTSCLKRIFTSDAMRHKNDARSPLEKDNYRRDTSVSRNKGSNM